MLTLWKLSAQNLRLRKTFIQYSVLNTQATIFSNNNSNSPYITYAYKNKLIVGCDEKLVKRSGNNGIAQNYLLFNFRSKSSDITNTMATIDSTFPVSALIPKVETNVSTFLQKYPEFNGKDVTIAIFDSGVDPQATGLKTLCDGKSVKVIERYDCSGCGDVDCSKKVTADADGYIEGLSGRKLKLTKAMLANNTNKDEFRIGLKCLNDLMAKKIHELSANKQKLKKFSEPNKKAIAEVSRRIVEFEAENQEISKLSWDKKLAKDNLDNLLELLNSFDKSYNDVKISYDCIVYHTENGWQVVVDSTENGDLENALHLGEYSKTHEIKNIDDYFYISANVHDGGDVLEIVGMCSSHGTHVASIASANHGGKDLDGVAPNANIVSFTIGDGRLGSMETGAALVRAMTYVMNMCKAGRKIDVINMSYGEHACWSNSGRIGQLMSEVVNKYGVVWVASAGNHGPALSTVGTPPDIALPSLIGVGAYISPQMMEAEYAMREKLPGNVYTWTSRDPCIDGGQGVTVCAPGGAIASVPQNTMSKSMLMNGTSMAAPHVAGAVALLISGLKQKGIKYSPFSIKRALAATATKLDYVDQFAQGSGLLNVDKAFEHLVEYANEKDVMMRFSVRVGPQSAKGIHVRVGPLKKPLECSVEIEPTFFNDFETDREHKFNYNVRLHLIPSQPFVQCGSFLDLSYHTRSIAVKIDPTGLPPGVHTANIRAYDSECVQKGALFEIPVTVIQPHIVNTEVSRTFESVSQRNDGTIEFQPNTIQRDFIFVPNGATWAVLRMRSCDKNRDADTGRFFLHTMQLLPKESCRKLELMKILTTNSETDTTLTFRVHANNILELCIAKYWSNYGSTHLKYSVEFHGLELINPNANFMQAALGVHKLEIAALDSEEVQPIIQLKNAVVVLKPIENKITPLSAARDMLPDGRQIYQNVLKYTLNIPKAQEVAIYAPLFNLYLYESAFESQFFMIFDANKNLIVCGDAHSDLFFTKLDKGDYTIKLQVRHELRDLLEKVNEAQLVVSFKLATALTLDIYDQYSQAILNKNKFVTAIVKQYSPRVLYVGALSQERISKANLPPNTSWISGSITLAKDEAARRVDIQKFEYALSVDSNKKSTNGNGATNNVTANTNNGIGSPKALKTKTALPAVITLSSAAAGDGIQVADSDVSTPNSPQKASLDEYAEGLRDFQCNMIKKLELEKAEKVYEEIITAHPKHLQAHLLFIQNLESTDGNNLQYPHGFEKAIKATDKKEKPTEDMDKLRTRLERIGKLADIVIKETDKDALLAYYGLKADTRADAAKIKTNMDKQKNNLVEALAKKGISLGKLGIINGNYKEQLAEFDAIYTEIVKFVDATDSKVIQFSLWHAYAHGQYGRMYKYLQKVCDDKRTRDILDELIGIAEAQGYVHIKTQIERTAITAFPHSYRLF